MKSTGLCGTEMLSEKYATVTAGAARLAVVTGTVTSLLRHLHGSAELRFTGRASLRRSELRAGPALLRLLLACPARQHARQRSSSAAADPGGPLGVTRECPSSSRTSRGAFGV